MFIECKIFFSPVSALPNPCLMARLWCHFSEKRFINSVYLAGQKAVWAHLLLGGTNLQML